MPTVPRLHVAAPLAAGGRVSLDSDAANYLVRVLRLGLGGEARLFNARDGEWQARIDGVSARKVDLELIAQRRAPFAPPAAPLWLLFAPVKKTETDLIVEKAVELGAARLWPVETERTQTHSVRLDRFERIVREAAEQTERLDLPELSKLAPLSRALAELPPGMALIFCDESADDPAPPIAKALQRLAPGPAALLIGPEGGFTAFERGALRARANTYPVSLGPRILRAETAAIAALAVWQALKGDWQNP